MEPTTSTHCRDILDRFRAQVHAHLPPITNDRLGHVVSESVIPLDRLPMIGQVVQQYIEAEAVYASASQQPGELLQPANN